MKKKIIITASLAACALAWVVYKQFKSPKIPLKPIVLIKTPPPSPTKLNDVTLQEFGGREGQGWKIMAQDVALHADSKTVECQNVACTIYLDKDDAVQVKAKNLVLDNKTRNLSITKDIEAFYKDVQLYSKELQYNFENQNVVLPTTSTITHPLSVSKATHTIIDTKTKSIVITGGITTEIFLTNASSNKRSN
jgi:lipopolysaccharide export system protein LptC